MSSLKPQALTQRLPELNTNLLSSLKLQVLIERLPEKNTNLLSSLKPQALTERLPEKNTNLLSSLKPLRRQGTEARALRPCFPQGLEHAPSQQQAAITERREELLHKAHHFNSQQGKV